jgi:hypothetical protein
MARIGTRDSESRTRIMGRIGTRKSETRTTNSRRGTRNCERETRTIAGMLKVGQEPQKEEPGMVRVGNRNQG